MQGMGYSSIAPCYQVSVIVFVYAATKRAVANMDSI